MLKMLYYFIVNTIFGDNRCNYEKTPCVVTMLFQNIWRNNSLPLNQPLFWITQCELEIRIWSLTSTLTIFIGCHTSQSKKCPSEVCHLSDVTLFSLLLYPEQCFSFIGNLHLALYQTLIFTSVPNTAVRPGMSKLFLIFHLGVLIFFHCR